LGPPIGSPGIRGLADRPRRRRGRRQLRLRRADADVREGRVPPRSRNRGPQRPTAALADAARLRRDETAAVMTGADAAICAEIVRVARLLLERRLAVGASGTVGGGMEDE